MRTAHVLAVSLALTALVPISAHAQGSLGLPVLARPFQYTDSDGPGTLTLTPMSTASTYPNWQKIQVTLQQRGLRYVGAGVYHFSQDAAPPAPPITYLWFTLLSGTGRSYFFEGRIEGSGAALKGNGTAFRVDIPQSSFPWQLQASSGQTTVPDTAQPILNNTPQLTGNWENIRFSEAPGGAYFASGNAQSGANAFATWSGTVPAGSYNVEVFLPARFAGDLVDRTQGATYKIAAAGPIEIRANQNRSPSGWVTLATRVGFDGPYRIDLTNETGETPGTLRVVASAVRLTPAR